MPDQRDDAYRPWWDGGFLSPQEEREATQRWWRKQSSSAPDLHLEYGGAILVDHRALEGTMAEYQSTPIDVVGRILLRVAACEAKAARTAWQSTEAMQLIREDIPALLAALRTAERQRDHARAWVARLIDPGAPEPTSVAASDGWCP